MSSPAEHYAAAEEILAKYHEADDQVRDPEFVDGLTELMGSDAAVAFVEKLLPGMTLLLQEAQVHATLATAKIVESEQ